METTLARLTQVFRDVFDDDTLVITTGTAAGDIEGWDSLMHVTLILNVEKAFRVKFTSTQVASLKNVGELVKLIEGHAQVGG